MKIIPKKLFIDIGPGTVNSEAWSKWYKDFTIIGLEPGTARYNNIKDRYPGKLLNVAVSDRNGEVTCWEHPEYGILFFRKESRQRVIYEKVKKKTIKLDSLDWKDFDEIYIWADVEGAELLVLKGATEILSSGKVKWINLEIRKFTPLPGWVGSVEIYEFLDKYGFVPSVPLDGISAKTHRDVVFTPIEVGCK